MRPPTTKPRSHSLATKLTQHGSSSVATADRNVRGMPRPNRRDAPGTIHHVTQRGNNQEDIFGERRDFALYLGLLSEVARAEGWDVLSYCLMPNHVHLLVRTSDATLSKGMARLHGRYALAYNRRRGGSGHAFQGRFHSRRVHSEAHLKAGFAYLALNPVRGRLVTHRTTGSGAHMGHWLGGEWHSRASSLEGHSGSSTPTGPTAAGGTCGSWKSGCLLLWRRPGRLERRGRLETGVSLKADPKAEHRGQPEG